MQIRVSFRGKTFTGKLHSLDDKRNVAHVHFGAMIGMREVSWNHGHGVGGFSSWKVKPEDLEQLRAIARGAERNVKPCGLGTGRPRKPRGAKPAHTRQLSFESYLEEK